ncbi:MAG: KpsF/GutQ family sugar-phosphate isomerase [Gemmatimonadota bacterium]
MSRPDPASLVEAGRRVLRLEANEIGLAADRLDAAFGRAVTMLAEARGRVIVSGVGKSGLIARKIAATFTSTGTPATFLHPVDSLHGDLGIVGRDDVAIVLSKSGESEELTGLLASLQRMAVPIIAITGGRDSILAGLAQVVLDGGVTEEACPHDLAPTASTTVALALGDALAVTLLEVKGFRADDFAALHPGGMLGRKLLLRVRDVMIPVEPVDIAVRMREAVMTLAHQRGLAVVTSGGTLAGVVTAGDLTRLAEQHPDFLSLGVGEVMTRNPKRTAPEDLAAAATGQMERHGIMALPVVEAGGRVVGVVHLHDLMRAGAV